MTSVAFRGEEEGENDLLYGESVARPAGRKSTCHTELGVMDEELHRNEGAFLFTWFCFSSQDRTFMSHCLLITHIYQEVMQVGFLFNDEREEQKRRWLNGQE